VRGVAIVLLTVLAAGAAAVTGIASTGAPAGEPAPAGFRLADGSAGCVLVAADELACRSADIDAAVSLSRDGSSRITDAEVSWDETMPVLRAAEQWWHAGFVCRVHRGRAYCAAGGGSVSAGGAAVGGME
jgi:hypothetical protein